MSMQNTEMQPQPAAPAPPQSPVPHLETAGEDSYDSGPPDEDIVAILHYDPFAPDSQLPSDAAMPQAPQQAPSQPGPSQDWQSQQLPGGQVDPSVLPPQWQPQSPVPQQPLPVGAEGPAPSTIQPVAPTAVGFAPDPRDATIEGLKAEMALMRQNMQQFSQQAPAQAAPEEPQIPMPQHNYQFQIPNELVNALGAEDPATRQVGIQALVQSVGQAIHREVAQMIPQQVNEIVQRQVPRYIEQNSQGDDILNDYYGNFPSHRAVAPLVGQLAADVSREYGVNQWSPQLRDMVAQRVEATLRAYNTTAASQVPQYAAPTYPMPQPQYAPAPAQQPVQPSHYPYVFSGNNSPGMGVGVTNDPNSPEGIARSLGF